jgi:hypothetical protein
MPPPGTEPHDTGAHMHDTHDIASLCVHTHSYTNAHAQFIIKLWMMFQVLPAHRKAPQMHPLGIDAGFAHVRVSYCEGTGSRGNHLVEIPDPASQQHRGVRV